MKIPKGQLLKPENLRALVGRLAFGNDQGERESYGEVVLVGRLREAIRRLNPRISELFQVTVPTVNEHLKGIFAEGELAAGATIRKFRIVRTEGKREVAREIEHYNLDAILAVGFRLRSHRGTKGTGRLLLVRVPAGENPPYGTALGVFKQRIGKNCMPLDHAAFHQGRIASGALDWSGEPAHGVRLADLDPVEMGRARAILRGKNPESDLPRANDGDFLRGLGAVRAGQVTHTGLLLFGQAEVIAAN